ncbi:MAG TPA: DUF4190 domain-containing protein [Candidatus Angelobacter sp.]|nr:DUF4190 domain-containing protein [Candidatus Angelobacter sp.]
MPDTSTVCPQCATPVQQGAATQPPSQPPQAGATAPRPQPGTPVLPQQPVSPWLNVPAAPAYTGQQETEGKAVGSLILGILAIFPLGLLAGIPAIILGHMSRASIRKSLGRLKGDGMALAGLIMGYVSIAAIPIVLIIAAIVIPNLLRAKVDANERAAISTLRTLNTAEISYQVTYGRYAPSLESLGPGAAAQCSQENPEHACLIDAALACSDTWCAKGGYKYHLTAICAGNNCTAYVITATPANSSTGTKSFCSGSDSVIRFSSGPQFEPLATEEECQSWTPR